MIEKYAPLRKTLLAAAAELAQPTHVLRDRVALDDPAMDVMTDLERTSAVLIRPDDNIAEANQRMIQRGVRLLLVVNSNRSVVGLITANDVLGEKPMQIIAARGCRHQDVLVSDIAVLRRVVEVLSLDEVRRACVGHIVATLEHSGRQHALAVETSPAGRQKVRGIFSMTQIARQLGRAVQTSGLAKPFSEVEAQPAHS